MGTGTQLLSAGFCYDSSVVKDMNVDKLDILLRIAKIL
jgi:hypothetical protein